jgi:hypothetical protein
MREIRSSGLEGGAGSRIPVPTPISGASRERVGVIFIELYFSNFNNPGRALGIR